jgi:DNA topoisomerase-2
MNIVRAVGLDFSKTYADGVKGEGLRYSKVVLMTDQDSDGSHIKGLVINLFEHFWPNLLYSGKFLHYIATPLVKVRKTTGKKQLLLSFYSLPEYDAWLKKVGAFAGDAPIDVSAYTVKYYKGLGTSTAAEAREYFLDTKKTFKSYFTDSVKGSNDAIDLAFNKDRAKDRRDWLNSTYDASSYIDPLQDKIDYKDFINKELIQFSFADNVRSLPCAIDGLKPAQRKVLYACFKKKLDSEMKVVQLAGYVAEQTAYHHGEASLHSTIINMAQDFVGSNNAPLLVPQGQFGTRSQGGKDFASPRYIFTQLSSIARLVFPASDDELLQYDQEDGIRVEPVYFVPIIPMLLVNGSQGIGTGWSTSIPPHDIKEVIDYTEALILGKSPRTTLAPNIRGFQGTVSKSAKGFVTQGVITKLAKTKIEITELPYG